MKRPGHYYLPRLSPYDRINQVPVTEVQEKLIENFILYGVPRGIHIDNGMPFGSPTKDMTPVLAFWLIGLGITVTWSRPRTPTDNAKVERCQGVTANWVEPEKCANLTVLGENLDHACRIQREEYPTRVFKGKTRLAAFPTLKQNPRKWANTKFNIQFVFQFLAKGKWIRKTCKRGQFWIFAKRWNLGVKYAKESIFIRFDIETTEWVVSDQHGKEAKRFSVENHFTEENIIKLKL
jgi:hypothetical protein